MTAPLHDRQAELAICGAALIDEGILDAVDVAPEQFADAGLRRVWAAMRELRAEGVALDEVTLPPRAGVDVALVAECAVATPTARNADHYAAIIREHALTRSVLAALAEVRAQHQDGKAGGKELLDVALAAITAIDVGRPRTSMAIGDVLKERMSQLDELYAARKRGAHGLTGIPTGLAKVDQAISGYQRGIVTAVAGRPGMGKSAFALAASHAASAAGFGVHVFSMEDSRAAYADRVIAQTSGVPAETVRSGTLAKGELVRFATAARDIMHRTNWIYEDAEGMRAEDIVRAVRRERRGNGTELVVVDYLQILGRPKKYENSNDAIEQNINVLADAAKADNMAYLVMSQLNRDGEKRQDKRPTLAELRGSGAIEQRAKCILGLYRGSYYGDPQVGIDYDRGDPPPSEEEWKRRLDVLVLKNNNGQMGTFVRVDWDGPTTRVS